MKKSLYIVLGSAMLLGATSCDDYLDTSSPSIASSDFVFTHEESAQGALNYAYEMWRGSSAIHSNGLFYDVLVDGDETTRQPERFGGQTRNVAQSMYAGQTGAYGGTNCENGGTRNFSIEYKNSASAFSGLYSIIGQTNYLTRAFEAQPEFMETIKNGKVTAMSDLYGQAVALRASCYFELLRFFGDVPYSLEPGVAAEGLTSRDYIYEDQIRRLKLVEPFMYRLGENASAVPTIMTRDYVDGLIGRMALYAAGYSTRRNDVEYVGYDGNKISFEIACKSANTNSFYARRSDYRKILEDALPYLRSFYTASLARNSYGYLVVKDERVSDLFNSESGKVERSYGNPYQYVFQKMMEGDGVYSPESVFEIPETRAVGANERPYAFGRPSNGAGSNAFPCKTYCQSRFNPLYYYNDFDPKDLRRDVTCAVTGSDGKGSEAIISLAGNASAKLAGGIALNKWDENRCSSPYILSQRQAGINCPYMRASDIYLMIAEIDAILGNEVEGKKMLEDVHNRAFAEAQDINAFIEKCGGSLLDAVIEERKLEFGGEGSRRYDLIRNNMLTPVLDDFHSKMEAMYNDLKTRGYHTFENGNVISNYIWVKNVDAKKLIGYRLTAQYNAPEEEEAGEYDWKNNLASTVLYPSWRGQNDDWYSVGYAAYTLESDRTKNLASINQTATNLSIVGLFRHVDEAEAKALEADGYTRVSWGETIIGSTDWDDYNKNVLCGYVKGCPPIYFLPFGTTDMQTSKITNGYGFQNVK
ncbi:MAG: RagB/SusD family nutrient uptake outer membrane protein [Bacteroidaceae bacterium]|nr:RagB/SusD family nutrient uptake outer membrane protein [Bacteroidaceae bacterium]